MGYGIVFKVTPAGSLTVLHNFDTVFGDGLGPFGPLIQGGDGNFYGTTWGSGPFVRFGFQDHIHRNPDCSA